MCQATNQKSVNVLSMWRNDDPIRFPFVESDDDYLKFPRHQLYRQSSKIAVLVADPKRHVTVEVTRNCNDKSSKPAKKQSSKSLPVNTYEFEENATDTTSSDSINICSSLLSYDLENKSEIKDNLRESFDTIITSQPEETLEQEEEFDTIDILDSDIAFASDELIKKIDELTDSTGRQLESSFLTFSANQLQFEGYKLKKNSSIHRLIEQLNRSCSVDWVNIGRNLLDFSKKREFLLSDVDLICEILSNDHLEVEDETAVFRAAHRWLRFKFPSRLVYGPKIMDCVRFGLIKPKDIVKCYARSCNIRLFIYPEFLEQLFAGLVWSVAASYDLAHLVPQLAPSPRISLNETDVFRNEDLPFTSTLTSITSLNYKSNDSDDKDANRLFQRTIIEADITIDS